MLIFSRVCHSYRTIMPAVQGGLVNEMLLNNLSSFLLKYYNPYHGILEKNHA